MNDELTFFLQQGKNSVKELARLTGKSTSTIYKTMGLISGVQSETGTAGKVFWLNHTQETNSDGPGATEQAPPTPTPIETSGGSPAPSTGEQRRGRKVKAAGMKLFPSNLGSDDTSGAGTYTNPRRANSHGYRSLQIIIDNPGITTEDYLSKGGRLNDLRWDMAHGNVRGE